MVPEFYQEDLAFIHDDGFGHLAEGAASLVLKLLNGVVAQKDDWLRCS